MYAQLGGHPVAVSTDVAQATLGDRLAQIATAIGAFPEGSSIRTALEDIQGHYTAALIHLDAATPAQGLDPMLFSYMQATAAGAHACAIAMVDIFQCLGGQLVDRPGADAEAG